MNGQTSYAINILFEEQYLDENDIIKTRVKSLVLDSVGDIQSNSSSTITDHPIVSGDIVADHMYKNPKTITFSGSAALKGHNGVIIDSTAITPTVLQDVFEQIKNNGYRCEIVKFALSDSSSAIEDLRFARYSNMVLTNIQIVEKINTIDFTLSWTQVLVADVQTLNVDVDDQYLPNVSEPQTTSFTDALIDWNQVDASVIKVLRQHDLIDPKLLDYMRGLGTTALVAIVGGAVAAAYVVFILSNPIGWIVGAVIAAVILVAGIISLFAKLVENSKYRIEQFKKYNSDKETDKEVKRFSNFVGEIHTQLEQLNNVIHVYQISSDEDQECMISIDNNYYIFTFTTNNTNGKRLCRVTDIEDSVRATIPDVSTSPSSYNACKTSNALFRADESGSYVYIVSPKVDGDFRLSNCFILVSQIKPEEYDNALVKIISNAIMR